jgi:hypothetical protein
MRCLISIHESLNLILSRIVKLVLESRNESCNLRTRLLLLATEQGRQGNTSHLHHLQERATRLGTIRNNIGQIWRESVTLL